MDLNLVENIQQSLVEGNMVAFVGAGMSVGAGLPGWYTLINELSARVSYDLPPTQWLQVKH